MSRMTHGTRSGYSNGCRCDECRDARKAYDKAYRQDNAERIRAYNRRPERATRRVDPEKLWARNQAKHSLPAQPCERCGAEKAHRHHPDYSRPLDVQWLCPSCHGIAHRKPDTGYAEVAKQRHQQRYREARAAGYSVDESRVRKYWSDPLREVA